MKNIYILLILFFVVSAKAQDTTQAEAPKKKSTVDILPVAGDFAIGADALPYLNFIGNMFNNSAANNLDDKINATPTSLGNQSLYLRYFLTDETAVRALISINSTTSIARNYVQDDAARFADPLSQANVEDKQTKNKNEYLLNAGYLMFRGYGRLRGYYGGTIGYGFGRETCTYQYGNSITVENLAPITSDFTVTPVTSAANPNRTLETDNGYEQMIGAGLVGGVEYYFAQKMCIGFEIGLGYDYSWRSQGDAKKEKLVGSNLVEYNVVNAPAGKTGSSITTFRPATYGGLYLMFHF
jgi:hypothetical protein